MTTSLHTMAARAEALHQLIKMIKSDPMPLEQRGELIEQAESQSRKLAGELVQAACTPRPVDRRHLPHGETVEIGGAR